MFPTETAEQPAEPHPELEPGRDGNPVLAFLNHAFGEEATQVMRHMREEVIQRTIEEFALLDDLVGPLSAEEWARLLPRSETKDPWTVKDALAHITHWKASVARSARKQPRPPEERGLGESEANHLIYLRWHERSLEEVLAWHRQVQEDVLAALREAPEEWFSGRERRQEWPFDLDGHSTQHRLKDIQRVLATRLGR